MAEPEYMSGGLVLLTAPAFVMFVLLMSIALGRRVLQFFGATSSASVGERVVVSATIGLGLLQFVPFILGSIGALSPNSVRIVFVVVAVLLLPEGRHLVPLAKAAWAERQWPDPWGWVWLGLLTVPLVFGFFLALAPAFDNDGISYHLGAPKQWLQEGSLTYLPTYIVTNSTLGAEMLFAAGLAFVGDAGAKLLHFASVVLGVIGVYLAGKRLSGPEVGRIASTLFLLGPFGVFVLSGWAYVEGFASLTIVAAVICWLIWYQHGDRQWLMSAALLCGMAVSFKLTSILFPVALGALTLLIVRFRTRADTGIGERPLRFTLGLTALAGLGMAPWFARSWIVADNPFYPVLARWIPSRDFPAQMSIDFEEYNRYFLWGNRWGDELSIDSRRAIIGIVVLLIIGAGGVLLRARKDSVERAVIVVVVATLVVQTIAAGLYTRYWIPIAAAAQLPIIAYVVRSVSRRWIHIGLIAGTLVLSLFAVRSVATSDPYQLVAASFDNDRREAFLLENVGLYPLYQEASNDLPPDSGVLMTYFCAGFYIDGSSYCAEFLQNSLRFSTWEVFLSDIDSLGVTHIIAPTALATGGPRPSDGNFAGSAGLITRDGMYTNVSRLLVERGHLLSTQLDQGLYELDPRS